MRFLQLAFTLLLIALHLLLGGALVLGYFPFASAPRQEALIRWWSRLMLRIFRVSVVIRGDTSLRDQGHMLLLNHISWVDIYVVHVYRATRFVAKSEIRSWPLVGWLCARTGTIFVERSKRTAVVDALKDVVRSLSNGELVGVFPEGTTSDGTVLLPFHANLIQAAINTGMPVVPATLRYRDASRHLALAAAYIGDMTLVDSAAAMLRCGRIEAELTLFAPIATLGKTRHEVSALARLEMLKGLDLEQHAGSDELQVSTAPPVGSVR